MPMRVKDVGTNLKFTVYSSINEAKPVDLTNIAKVQVNLKLNDNKVVSKQGVVVSPSKGVVMYKIEEGDLAEVGTLHMEVELVFTDGSHFTSSSVSKSVKEVL